MSKCSEEEEVVTAKQTNKQTNKNKNTKTQKENTYRIKNLSRGMFYVHPGGWGGGVISYNRLYANVPPESGAPLTLI